MQRTAFSLPTPGGAGAAALFERGLAHHRAGALEPAAQAYLAALALDSHNFDALHMLGALFIQAGQPEQGVQFIDAAIVVKPRDARAHANRANGLNRLGCVDIYLVQMTTATSWTMER
jgi:protein O-GlcNAc transferase